MADVKAQNSKGQTALDIANDLEHDELIAALETHSIYPIDTPMYSMLSAAMRAQPVA